MRTAETIIREYLERGYSLESLRVLAESRSEPLCSEMLAILKQMEGRDVLDVPCEAAAGEDERIVFFIADEAQVEVEEIGVDFDIMAESAPDGESESPPASLEESVAEITIGETEGASVVSFDPANTELQQVKKVSNQDPGIWSRLWQAELDSIVEKEEKAPEMRDESSSRSDENGNDDILSEIDSAQISENLHDTIEQNAPATSEGSSDYLPGTELIAEEAVALETKSETVSELSDQESGVQRETAPSIAPAADLETPEAIPETKAEEPEAAEEPAALAEEEAPVEAETPAPPPVAMISHNTLPDTPAHREMNKKEARKERRRRERAEKKKQKQQAKNEASIKETILPEIILTRSEDTDTMVPEMHPEQALDSAHLDLSAPALEYTPAEPQAEEIVERAEEAARPEIDETPETVSETPEDAAELDEADQVAAPEEDAPALSLLPPAEADDHAMIIATGGLDLRSDAYNLLLEDSSALNGDMRDYEPVEEEAIGNNVILFRANYVYQEMNEEEGEEIEDSLEHQPVLRMLPPVEDEKSEDAVSADSAETEESLEAATSRTLALAAPEPAPAVAEEPGLSPSDRLGLLRAFVGNPEEMAEAADAAQATAGDHVIVSQEPEPLNPLAEAEEARKTLEAEYQRSLDDFARQLLEVQTVAAAKETLLRERADEMQRRDEELAGIRRLQAELEEKAAALAKELEDAKGDASRKQSKLDEFKDVLDEHERLYNEFEDLRKAYNEVVVEVMPALQNERDDLALTVERQCESQDRLRSSLGSARKRLAVGYSLGAAACLMLVALPVFNWLRSGDDSRGLAMDHQKTTELRDRLEKAEMRNVQYEKDLFELERKAGLQLADLEERNRELAHLANQRTAELAGAKAKTATSGTPTRTSAMVGPTAQSNNGRLAVNEVRDPAGQIDQTVAANRARYSNMPAPPSDNTSRIAVSAVASTRPQTAGNQSSPVLRPPAGNAATGSLPARAGTTTQTASASQKPGEVLAKVKAGEGVAQVVYRVLGTRDPEVINWVIRENSIKNDKRGNPRIYPDQELRLPQGGRTAQTAAAPRR